MKHCFKKFMALLLATLMVMGAFSSISVFAENACKHETWEKWEVNGVTTVAPTCTEPGYTWYRCTNPDCGKVDARDFIPALGHDLVWECTAEDYADVVCGNFYKIYLGCSRCDYVEKWADETVVEGYKTHIYSAFEIVTQPTCTDNGLLNLICTEHEDCKKIAVKIDRLNYDGNHTPVVVNQKYPTCTEDGFVTYKCALCPVDSWTVVRKAEGHADDEGVYLDAKTCVKTFTCGRVYTYADGTVVTDKDGKPVGCGATYTKTEHRGTDLTTAKHHAGTAEDQNCYDYTECNWCGKIIDSAPNHKVNATHKKRIDTTKQLCVVDWTCLDCGKTWTEDATVEFGHGDLHVNVVSEPTCTKYGTTAYVCLDCGFNSVVMTEPLAHDWDVSKWSDEKKAEFVKTTTASCEVPGGTLVYCGNGCKTVDPNTVTEEALGHKWKVVSTVAANCQDPKTTTQVCERCGKTEKITEGEAVAGAHVPENWTITTPPTCTTSGIATYFCKICDAVFSNIDYEDAIATDENGNKIHPDWIAPLLKPYNHTYTTDHASILPEGKKVGDSALRDATTTPATCQTAGAVYKYCAICSPDVAFKYQDLPVDPTNHEGKDAYMINGVPAGWDDPSTTEVESYLRLPSCTSDALLWLYCDKCSTPYAQVATGSKLKHDVENEAKFTAGTPATCEKPGVEAKWEVLCGRVFYVINRINGVELESGDIDTNNDGKADLLAKDGYTVDVNGDVLKNGVFQYGDPTPVACDHVTVTGGETIPAKVHDWADPAFNNEKDKDNFQKYIISAGTAATCTTAGQKPLWVCTDTACDYYKADLGYGVHPENDGSTIAALGHSQVNVAAVDAGCTTDGNVAHVACSRVGCSVVWLYNEETEQYDIPATDAAVVIPATGHTPAAMDKTHYCDAHVKVPTCTEAGVGYGPICKVCGKCTADDENGSEHEVIPAIGHKYITISSPIVYDDEKLEDQTACEYPTLTFSFCQLCAHTEACINDVEKEIPCNDNEKIVIGDLGGINANTESVGTIYMAGALADDYTDADKKILEKLLKDTNYIRLTYGKQLYLGDINLDKYSSVKITYAIAASKAISDNFAGMKVAPFIGLKSAAGAYGYPGTDGYLDMSNSLGAANMVYSADSYSLRTMEINLEFAEKVENVWLSAYLPGTPVIITDIEFVADSYGCHEIDAYKYAEGHKMVTNYYAIALNDKGEQVRGNKIGGPDACDGYITAKECSKCGKVESEVLTQGVGHDIVPHSDPTKAELECGVCHEMVDAHENKYVIVSTTTIYETSHDEKYPNGEKCVKAVYALVACTECEYRGMQMASAEYQEHDFAYSSTTTKPTYSDAGVDVYKCSKCGVSKNVATDKLTGVNLSMTAVNANGQAGYTDGSLIKVTVTMSSANIAMWGYKFDVDYDHNVLEFVSAEYKSTIFDTMDHVNNNVIKSADGKTIEKTYVTVLANTHNNAAGQSQNINVNGDEVLVDLYFRVNCAEKLDTTLSFNADTIEVLNNGNIPVYNDEGVQTGWLNKNVTCGSSNCTVSIQRYLDVNYDNDVNLADALQTYQMITGEWSVGYSVIVDVDKDGALTLADFKALYEYIAGIKTYDEMRKQGIN